MEKKTPLTDLSRYYNVPYRTLHQWRESRPEVVEALRFAYGKLGRGAEVDVKKACEQVEEIEKRLDALCEAIGVSREKEKR